MIGPWQAVGDTAHLPGSSMPILRGSYGISSISLSPVLKILRLVHSISKSLNAGMLPKDLLFSVHLVRQKPRLLYALVFGFGAIFLLTACMLYDDWEEPPLPLPEWLYKSKPSWITVEPKAINFTQLLEAHKGRLMYSSIIPELRNAPPPSTHVCADHDSFGPLALIGVFSVAKAWEQRAVVRSLQARGMNADSPRVEFRFILGRDQDPRAREIVELEQAVHGDIVILEIEENMNDGKTYAYFKWAAERPEGHRPRFVLKADDDTFLVLPNVLHSLSSFNCSVPLYWGTAWGSCLDTCFPFYMRGMAYAFSWPVVRWLASADLQDTEYVIGMEDVRAGSWMRSLPPSEPIQVVNHHMNMGDWDGLTIVHDSHIVAMHAMKTSWHWVSVATELINKWEQAGREYAWPPHRRKGNKPAMC